MAADLACLPAPSFLYVIPCDIVACRDSLFRLADNDETAEWVAEAVTEYFDKLPSNVQNLLFRLAEKDNTQE